MYCQACGTSNPDEARFCMACGTRLMEPTPAGQAWASPGPEGSRLGQGPGPRPASPPQKLDAALEQLESETTGTMAGLSISLAAMGIRSPRRTAALAAGLLVLLVGLGVAGALAYSHFFPADEPARQLPEETLASGPLPVLGVPAPVGEADGGPFVTTGPVITQQEVPPTVEEPPARRKRRRSSRRPSSTASSSSVPATTSPAAAAVASLPTGAALGEADQGASRAANGAASTPVKSQPQPAPAPSAPAGQSSPTEASEATDDRFDELGDSPTSIELDMYAGHVRRVIRRFYAARARSCFERATRNNHSLRGTVVVRFTIGGQGQVEQSQSIHNTTGNEDLGRCLAGQVGSWRLPPPPAGQTLELEMPFSA